MQLALLNRVEWPEFDASWSARRDMLDDDAWIDHAPGWLKGQDRLGRRATCHVRTPCRRSTIVWAGPPPRCAADRRRHGKGTFRALSNSFHLDDLCSLSRRQ